MAFFKRLVECVGNPEGSLVHYSQDNREIEGWNHQLRLNQRSMKEVFPPEPGPGDPLGVQLKQYYPKNPGQFDEGDALYHPKVGVLFAKKFNKSAFRWGDVDDLLHALEEMLLNVMFWGGLHIDPGPTFVSDDAFEAVASDRDIAWFDDPTPRIQKRHDILLVHVLRNLSPAQGEVLDELLEAEVNEGKHIRELADGSGRSLSTVYRALDRAKELAQNENRDVRFVSERVRQQFLEIVEPVERQIDVGALFDPPEGANGGR